MKLLFTVQGEGRGHMTQALAVQQWCRRHGHQVVGVVASAHRNRSWPDFFESGFDVPVTQIVSPGFVYRQGRAVNLPATLWQLATQLGDFRQSLQVIDQTIQRTQPDVVLNFLEPLVGFASFLGRRRVPVMAIGHQFMLQHPVCPRAVVPWVQRFGLNRYVALTGRRSVRYGLSFYETHDQPEQSLFVAPPLLRDELFQLDGSVNSGHLLVYLLNAGYRPEIEAWHARHPEIPLHAFYDRTDAPPEEKLDATLTFHRLHGEKFLRLMSTCRAVVCTAGFESLSEAAWLGKPALAVPVENHVEQSLNAVDAEFAGLALGAKHFDLDRLLAASSAKHPTHRFRDWVRQSDSRLLRALQCTILSGRISETAPIPARRSTEPSRAEIVL